MVCQNILEKSNKKYDTYIRNNFEQNQPIKNNVVLQQIRFLLTWKLLRYLTGDNEDKMKNAMSLQNSKDILKALLNNTSDDNNVLQEQFEISIKNGLDDWEFKHERNVKPKVFFRWKKKMVAYSCILCAPPG